MLNTLVAPQHSIEHFRHVHERSADYIFLSCKGQPCHAKDNANHAPAWQGVDRATVPTVSPKQSGLCGAISRSATGVSSSYDGRVEHLVSGQVARFHSLEELLAFMIRVLTEVEEQSDSP